MASHELRSIILAAGKGTRMKSDTVKVLHEVCGKPIIKFVLDVARYSGSLKNYVVIGHQGEMVKQVLSATDQCVVQKQLLGTADAVRRVEPFLKNFKGEILILCGDTPLLSASGIKQMVQFHRRKKAAVTILTSVLRDPSGYGRIVHDERNAAIAIREDKDVTPEEKQIAEINTGVYCFNAVALWKALKAVEVNAKKGEFYLTDTVALLAKNGKIVETVQTKDPQEGLGINTRHDLALAHSVMNKNILDYWMANGVTIVDPNTTYIQADVKIGQDTIIYPCSFIDKDVTIGARCRIGPMAHIRSGSRIGNDVQIGNFAEVSRTTIDDQSLVKHFSFLGDARVGKKVNIGAGTVTANYDGKDKNITTIKDNAFIGSDSILIAPLKVGRGAKTGAGTVVTRGKNIPDNGVAVGVPARILKK